MLRFGRYPALLVSRHFSWLAKKNGHEACDQPLYDQFISEQELLQTTLLTSLRNDFYYNSFAEDEGIAEKQQLVSL